MPPHPHHHPHHHGGHRGGRGWGPWPYAYPYPMPVAPICMTANDTPDVAAAILRSKPTPDPRYGSCPSCGRVSGVAMTQAGECSEVLCNFERRWFPAAMWGRPGGAISGIGGAELGGDGESIVGRVLWFAGTAAAIAVGIGVYAYYSERKKKRRSR